MRLIRPFLVGFAMLVIAGVATPLSAADGPGHSVSIAFATVPSSPEQCMCSAEIKDLATNEVIAAPRVVFRKGESGKVNTGNDKGSLVLEFKVNKAGTAGEYTVTFTQGGKVVSVQKGKISI